MIHGYTDHAANERTFLAWVRTAIAVIAFGFVIEKFNLFVLTVANANSLDAERRLQLERLSGPLGRYDGLGVDPKVASAIVGHFGDLRVRGARAQESAGSEKGSGNDRNGGKTSAKRSKSALASDHRWPGKAHL